MNRDYAPATNMALKLTPEAWTKEVWRNMKQEMNWREYEQKQPHSYHTPLPHPYEHPMRNTITNKQNQEPNPKTNKTTVKKPKRRRSVK